MCSYNPTTYAIKVTIETGNYLPDNVNEIMNDNVASKLELPNYDTNSAAIIICVVFIIYPVFNTFYLSFQKWNGLYGVAKEWVGWQNYTNITFLNLGEDPVLPDPVDYVLEIEMKESVESIL